MNPHDVRIAFPSILGPAQDGMSLRDVEREADSRVEGWVGDPQELATVVDRLASAGEVSEHRVRLSKAWIGDGELPEHVRSAGSVTRGDCFDLAAECARTGRWLPLLRLSYAWGTGSTGYGHHRWQLILAPDDEMTSDAKRSVVERRLGEAVALLPDGAGLAYFHLNNISSGRLSGLGPAFFTKFLYFAGGPQLPASTDQPLILDAVLARAIRKISGGAVPLPNASFTTPQYAIYLSIMRRLATRIGDAPVPPDRLELALFTTG